MRRQRTREEMKSQKRLKGRKRHDTNLEGISAQPQANHAATRFPRPLLGRNRTPVEDDAKPPEHDIKHINQEAQKMLRRQTHRQNKSSGKPTTRSPGYSSEGIQHPRKAMRTRLNTTSGTRTRKQKLRAATSSVYVDSSILCGITGIYNVIFLTSVLQC